MRNYEVFLIVQADLDETALNAIVEKVKGWITDSGGSVTKVDNWGKRRMAFIIKKQREGQYVLIHAELAPSFVTDLERNLRFQESIIRSMITNVA